MRSITAILALLALAACGDPCYDEDGDGATGSDECTKDMPLDCDDSDAAVHPSAEEVCNEVDDNCDGFVDNAASDAMVVYTDADGDGYGEDGTDELACFESAGLVEDNTDCDDGNAAINPGADEACNQVDDDCDGLTDTEDTEVVGTITVFPDADGDGHGDETSAGDEACSAGGGESLSADDCDDADNSVSPSATEVCDALDVDEDCDGVADDADTSTDPASLNSWYPDEDSDGYGDAFAPATLACDAPSGQVADSTDCDDSDDQRPAVIPCYEGSWSLEDAVITLEADSTTFGCIGDVSVDVDASGDMDGSGLSCTISGVGKTLPYDLTGSFTSGTLCEGTLDFSATGGPSYDFDGELTTDGTLLIQVDQTMMGVYVTVDWELEKD